MRTEENMDKEILLPIEDYFMLSYIAGQEKVTPAELIKNWMFEFLDSKDSEKK